ncbi:MAG: efflux RND transporter periplasmic adaptor subunit [Gammaproteobacteria bacterium]|nr:efflux RND transporter periplasmic adaptor subunit [Gammaproteobacteria bacterium]
MNRLAILLLASFALASCGKSQAPGPAPAAATPVRTAIVESVDVGNAVRSVGVLAPRDEFRLSFKVGGVIDSIAVDAGDAVRKGQVLALIKRAEVDAAVAQASEATEKARRDLERGQRLRADEVATEEQVQDLTTAYNVARANLEAARFNARFARIEAPGDGVVLQKLAEANELVQAGQPVLVLGGTGAGWIVRTALADRDAVRVNVGDVARVAFDAFPGREFAGKVTRVGSSADPLTGTFEVEIDVAPDGARFVRGLVAKVSLDISDGDAAGIRTVVPVTAIVEANGAVATVYLLDAQAGVARRRQVTVGPLVGDRVIVTAGLAAGDRVVTDGAAWLADGKPVHVVGQQG